MDKVTILKNTIQRYNPIARYRRYCMKSRLFKRNITLFTPDCLGGILFHDLDIQFQSPTVNLMMTQSDFLSFVLNWEAYTSNGRLDFFKHKEYSCPCAFLNAGMELPIIKIHFTHYEDEQIAKEKWFARIKRIQSDNIFVVIEERDGITKTEIEELGRLKVRGIVAFTCNEYSDIPYSVFIPKYKNEAEVGNILKRNYLTDGREYEEYFDFVEWFNQADRKDYDVKRFIK